jgi:hypothetical protein
MHEIIFHRRELPGDEQTLCGLDSREAIVTEPANCPACLAAWALFGIEPSGASAPESTHTT